MVGPTGRGVGRKSSAFPTRVNCRSVVIGLGVIASAFVLLGFYWSHLSADAATTSVLMSKISKLEESLLEHHQHEHGELKRGSQEHAEDLEKIKGDLTDVQSSVKAAEEEKKALVLEKDREIQELNRKVSELTTGLSAHEHHHKMHIEPNMHTHPPLVIGDSGHPGALKVTQKSSGQQLRGAEVSSSSSPLLPGATSTTSSRDSALGAAGLGVYTALLVIASKRPEYLERCLSKVVLYHPGSGALPIVVSEDGDFKPVRAVVNNARAKLLLRDPQAEVIHLNHPRHGSYTNGYFALADHFKWALRSVFNNEGAVLKATPQRVIILEEDLEIAPDFFSFFAAVAPMVEADPTLLTASAWNDNGQVRNVRDTQQVYRSDFFPGLGWLMTAQLWKELEPKWPKAYWDDWLREPKNRLGRHTLRPEVCRTLHYGRVGVSNAQYQDTMADILLNRQPVNFPSLDLSYLQAQAWDKYYIEGHVKKALHTTPEALDRNRVRDKSSTGGDPGDNLPLKPVPHQEYYIEYDGNSGFERLARWAGVMDNIKANVPRTAYKGVVSFWIGGSKLHLVPRGFVSAIS